MRERERVGYEILARVNRFENYALSFSYSTSERKFNVKREPLSILDIFC